MLLTEQNSVNLHMQAESRLETIIQNKARRRPFQEQSSESPPSEEAADYSGTETNQHFVLVLEEQNEEVTVVMQNTGDGPSDFGI